MKKSVQNCLKENILKITGEKKEKAFLPVYEENVPCFIFVIIFLREKSFDIPQIYVHRIT